METQRRDLESAVDRLQKQVQQLQQERQILIQGYQQLLEWGDQIQQDFFYYQRNAAYEIQGILQQDTENFFPKICTVSETVREIVINKKSMARFGDGEFSMMAGRVRHGFQTIIDETLQQRLQQVLQSEDENLLIGLANNYGSLEPYTTQAKREIRCYMNPQIRREHLRLLNPQKQYYDAYVTRPYVMYADQDTDAPQKRFLSLREIWKNRSCVFVEGNFTRLGVGNNLFDNVTRIRRILGPAENAWLQYENILEACMQLPKDTLFLLALGSTATVLAYDLCRAGYQAVDVGHVDLEYEWYQKGEGRRCFVPGKYNNEFPGEDSYQEPMEETYQQQVIADFSGV